MYCIDFCWLGWRKCLKESLSLISTLNCSVALVSLYTVYYTLYCEESRKLYVFRTRVLLSSLFHHCLHLIALVFSIVLTEAGSNQCKCWYYNQDCHNHHHNRWENGDSQANNHLTTKSSAVGVTFSWKWCLGNEWEKLTEMWQYKSRLRDRWFQSVN